MSSPDKYEIPSNEAVINSLVEELEGSLRTGDSGEEKDPAELLEKLEEPAEPEQAEEDDLVDEELLKKSHEGLSDEERAKLREEADQLKEKGNQLFREQEYEESAKQYTLGLRTCPLEFVKLRAVLFSNRCAAKQKLGLDASALQDCDQAVTLDPGYVKALSRRAALNQKLDKLDAALEDYTKLLQMDPSNKEAGHAVMTLPQQINERNEKLKAEMLGSLKQLGNVILRPFGLSTDNFQMVQDPNTGGYSVNFKSN